MSEFPDITETLRLEYTHTSPDGSAHTIHEIKGGPFTVSEMLEAVESFLRAAGWDFEGTLDVVDREDTE